MLAYCTAVFGVMRGVKSPWFDFVSTSEAYPSTLMGLASQHRYQITAHITSVYHINDTLQLLRYSPGVSDVSVSYTTPAVTITTSLNYWSQKNRATTAILAAS